MNKKTLNHNTIHVVAAVIENSQQQVFIAKRHDHVHQGGLWEFPGGKLENGESVEAALKREIYEELDIEVKEYEPLIQIAHNYPDKSVFLDVWRIKKFIGDGYGKEGQETRWVNKDNLFNYQFPAANKPILTAITLPTRYLITPEPNLNCQNAFLETIEEKLKNGINLLQLRAKSLNTQQLQDLYHKTQAINKNYNAKILLNTSIAHAKKINANAVHLSSTELHATTQLPTGIFTAASCHTIEDIKSANQLGVDFIVLSPVLKTSSHPDALPLGWDKFAELCQQSTTPVYALGGMQDQHVSKAISFGAQGIAAISAFW